MVASKRSYGVAAGYGSTKNHEAAAPMPTGPGDHVRYCQRPGLPVVSTV